MADWFEKLERARRFFASGITNAGNETDRTLLVHLRDVVEALEEAGQHIKKLNHEVAELRKQSKH